MRKTQRVKLRKIGYSSMFVASLLMAIPTNAFAAVAEELNEEPTAIVEVAEPVEETEANADVSQETIDEQTERCTGIYVGGDVTENGDTFIGRSEDLNGNNRKVFEYVPAAKHDSTKEFYEDVDSNPDFKLAMPEETVGYTAVHDDAAEWGVDGAKAYAANGINDNGVAITATTTTYMSEGAAKVDPEVEGSGLAECVLGDILLGQAKSPKHACEVAGQIIKEHGAAEGYQFYAGNSEETWMFSTLSGHQWIAFRIPKDKLMVNPNIGGLQYKIDLNDKDSYICSEGMIELAKENGFDKYFEDGTFNPFASYGNYSGGTGNNGSVNSRLWQGYQYLTGSDEVADQMMKDHPLFFDAPQGKKYSTFEVLRLLGFQGKGTKLDSTQEGAITGWVQPWGREYQENLCRAIYGNKDGQGLYPIGNLNQLQCHVFQIRNDQSIPQALREIQWQCMGSASYGIFLPFYTGLQTKMPAIYSAGSVAHDNLGAMSPDIVGANSMYYTMTDFSKLVSYCVNAGADMSAVEQYRDNMQKDLIKQQVEMEKAMKDLDPAQYTAAANNMCEVLSNNLHQKTLALNSLLRAYAKAGDFSKPFTFDFADQVLPSTVDALHIGDDEPRDVNYNAGAVDGGTQTDDQTTVDETTQTDDKTTVDETTQTDNKVTVDESTQTTDKAVDNTVKPAAKKAVAAKATPQTGDATNMVFPIVIAIAGAGAVYTSIKKREEI